MMPTAQQEEIRYRGRSAVGLMHDVMRVAPAVRPDRNPGTGSDDRSTITARRIAGGTIGVRLAHGHRLGTS
jgi:hypothetical protein